MKSRTDYKLAPQRIKQLKNFLLRLKIDPEDLVNISESDLELKLQIINEALTHTSAQAKYNHERLEFLGDAVLRLAASEFIDRKFPYMKVGERSALRSQIVSDDWLASVGESIQIEEILIIGTKASKDSSALQTLQAEATEALIGAIYECFRDLHKIHNWLYQYWLVSSNKFLDDPYRQNPKSALQEWSQSNGLKLPKYEIEEITQHHGDPNRFFCKVYLEGNAIGKGWGRSRKLAEKEAAKFAMQYLSIKDYD